MRLQKQQIISIRSIQPLDTKYQSQLIQLVDLIQPRAFNLSISPSDRILALNFTVIGIMGSSGLDMDGLKHFFLMINKQSSRYMALSQAGWTCSGKRRICLQCSGVGRKSLGFIPDSRLLTQHGDNST